MVLNTSVSLGGQPVHKEHPVQEEQAFKGSSRAVPVINTGALHGHAYIHTDSELDAVSQHVSEHPEDTTFFLNIAELERTANIFQEHFMPGSPHADIAYAVKANPDTPVLSILHKVGIDCFDCASLTEVEAVRQIDQRAKILFNQPVKRRKDIIAARWDKVKHFTAQTAEEVQKIVESGPFDVESPLEIAARVKTRNKGAAINLASKFGTDPEKALALIRDIKDRSAAAGIGVHTGSQNGSVESYRHAVGLMCEIAECAGAVSTMNVGGGIPVNYRSEDRFSTAHYLQSITRALKEARDSFPRAFTEDHRFIVEVGRSMVATALTLVVPILAVEKRTHSADAVYIYDGVFGSFVDYPIHDWRYHFEVLERRGDEFINCQEPASRMKKYQLYGPTCDSGDHMGEVLLPEGLKPEKHFIALRNAGAYMRCTHSGFNGIDMPELVLYN